MMIETAAIASPSSAVALVAVRYAGGQTAIARGQERGPHESVRPARTDAGRQRAPVQRPPDAGAVPSAATLAVANQYFDAHRLGLRFEVRHDPQHPGVRLIDRDSGRIVQQYAAMEALAAAQRMVALRGALLRETA